MRQSVVRENDAYAVSDGLGVFASTRTDAPFPSNPEALLWLIQHARDLWLMRVAEAQAGARHR